VVAGDIIVTVTSLSGTVIDTFQTTYQAGIPVRCKYPHLSSGVYIISARKIPDGPLARGKVMIIR
jgi:hypothetical protein